MKDGTEKKVAKPNGEIVPASVHAEDVLAETRLTRRDAKDIVGALAVQANAFDALCAKVDRIGDLTAGEVQDIREDMARFSDKLEHFNLAIEQVQTLVRDSLALERQRLAKERDLEHQRILRGITATRHARAQVEVTPEDIAEARRLNEQMRAEADARDAEKPIPMSEFKGKPA